MQKQVEFLDRYPDIAVVGSSYRIIDGADRAGKQVDLPLLHDDIRKRLERSNCMAHPT